MKTKLLTEREEKTYAVVFDKGDEVIKGLESFAKQEGLEAAHFTAIGAFEDVTLGYFDWETKDYDKIVIREQVWDSDDIPERELFFGQPSGSAMPLVWAHAEYVKLRRSLEDQKVFDTPPQTVTRYLEQATGSPHAPWRFSHQAPTLLQGKVLRVETLAPARVHWSANDWQTARDNLTGPTGLELHVADLPTQDLPAGSRVTFTFYWMEAERWENQNFTVTVEAGTAQPNTVRAASPKKKKLKQKRVRKRASKAGAAS